MGTLASELERLGYEPTDRESPFDDDGDLWTNSYELVCDATGIVIRKDGSAALEEEAEETVYRYRHTEKIKMPGGFVSSYDWGKTDDGLFTYDERNTS